MTFSILLHLFQVDYTCFYPEIRIRVKFLNWEQKKKNNHEKHYTPGFITTLDRKLSRRRRDMWAVPLWLESSSEQNALFRISAANM